MSANRDPARVVALLASLAATSLSFADEPRKPWMDTSLSPDRRAELVVAEMTRAEKQSLVFGYFATEAPWKNFKPPKESREGSAGYIPGIARLGIPAQL